MLEWKDNTSYSRGEEKIPNSWIAQVGIFSIGVTNNHIYHKGKWIGWCHGIFTEKALNVNTEEEAKAKVVSMLHKLLSDGLQAIEKA